MERVALLKNHIYFFKFSSIFFLCDGTSTFFKLGLYEFKIVDTYLLSNFTIYN